MIWNVKISVGGWLSDRVVDGGDTPLVELLPVLIESAIVHCCKQCNDPSPRYAGVTRINISPGWHHVKPEPPVYKEPTNDAHC